MREKDVETYLKTQIEKLGGRAYKFVSPGCAGVPDRLVCLPGGLAAFVELKAPGEKPRPMQVYRMKQLRELGFVAVTLDSKEAVNTFVQVLGDRA